LNDFPNYGLGLRNNTGSFNEDLDMIRMSIDAISLNVCKRLLLLENTRLLTLVICSTFAKNF